ncbi:MAG: FIST N-terminal domain-containing protein [Acidimicrobiales bacterium]
MIAETSTWRAAGGWVPSVPEPDGRAAIVLVAGDREALAAAAECDADPLGDLGRAWAGTGAGVLGWSTAGHTLDGQPSDGAVAVLTLRFDDVQVRSASTSLTDCGTARRAGRELADALAAPDLRVVLVVADGLRVNGSILAAGIADVLPDVPVLGVLAADGDRYGATWTLCDGVASDDAIVAVGLCGDALELHQGVAAGWHPVGPERLVTSSHGNVVHEIDGAPPAELYREYLGALADEFVANGSMLPLEVRDLDDRRTLRSLRAVRDDGSIVVSGDVAQGASVRLLRASAADLLLDAELAGKAAWMDGPAAALVISSAGRRRVLGERADDEALAALGSMPAGMPSLAAWTYGALVHDGELTDVHDESICVVTLRERDPGRAAVAADTPFDAEEHTTS